jgi:hypothetical protein
MAIRLRAEDEPANTRLDYWQHVVGTSFAPYHISASGDTLRSQIQQAQIGTVSLVNVQMSALQAVRTADLVRKSDRGMCKINLGIRGRGGIEQDGRQSVLTPGEFLLTDLGRPSQVAVGTSFEASVFMFPGQCCRCATRTSGSSPLPGSPHTIPTPRSSPRWDGS